MPTVTDFLTGLGGENGLVSALQLGLLGRLLLAAALGGLVGYEREISGKPAGLRTNLLICVGAALLMELSIGVAALANEQNVLVQSPFRADPGRIAAQIVSGIGFLGAGTILQARGNIVGLTTAATIWVVAAIGMAVGAQAYVIAIGSTVLVVVSLGVLGRVENAMIRRSRRSRYLISLDGDPDLLQRVEDAFRSAGLRVDTESVEKKDGLWEAHFEVTGAASRHGAVLRDLIAREGIHRLTRVT
jgi:putative Mg2+ transporter-C (MgtC) family protein